VSPKNLFWVDDKIVFASNRLNQVKPLISRLLDLLKFLMILKFNFSLLRKSKNTTEETRNNLTCHAQFGPLNYKNRPKRSP
jgi:hypothetical protein